MDRRKTVWGVAAIAACLLGWYIYRETRPIPSIEPFCILNGNSLYIVTYDRVRERVVKQNAFAITQPVLQPIEGGVYGYSGCAFRQGIMIYCWTTHSLLYVDGKGKHEEWSLKNTGIKPKGGQIYACGDGVLFNSEDASGKPCAFVFDLRTNRAWKVPSALSAASSPDGREIAYATEDGKVWIASQSLGKLGTSALLSQVAPRVAQYGGWYYDFPSQTLLYQDRGGICSTQAGRSRTVVSNGLTWGVDTFVFDQANGSVLVTYLSQVALFPVASSAEYRLYGVDGRHWRTWDIPSSRPSGTTIDYAVWQRVFPGESWYGSDE